MTTTKKTPDKTSTSGESGKEERPSHKVKADQVKAGDMMAIIHFVKVNKADTYNMSVTALDEGLGDFHVNGKALIENALSADQYHEECKVTKTRAAEILITAHNRPLTVCFEKQDGEDRTLRGRLVAPEPLLGRSHVEDLDIVSGHRLRLVDHRTIRYIIVEGTKYTVKGK